MMLQTHAMLPDEELLLKAVSDGGGQGRGKVVGVPGFVLHSRPYKETSLLLELWTRDYGRISALAKGAKRPASRLRSVLMTLQPLQFSWTGKTELKTLTEAEWVGGMPPIEKSALLCGFYLNELLLRFFPKDEAHPQLFERYVHTLNQLAHGVSEHEALRRFELALLREAGYLGDVLHDSLNHQPVESAALYTYDPQHGIIRVQGADPAQGILGQTLQAMHNDDFTHPVTLAQSKALVRCILAHHLNGAALHTRQLLIDLYSS